MRHAANCITGARILFSLGLLLCAPRSIAFWALYLLAGLSDAVDGTVARKTNSVTPFGSRLDTAADLAFAAVCLWKLLPGVTLPSAFWWWLGVIALIKIVNIVSGFVMFRRFVAAHTVMNKITGLLLFLLPLAAQLLPLTPCAAAVCAVATFAAVQEGHFIRTGRAD